MAEYQEAFAALRRVLAAHSPTLKVTADTPSEYSLYATKPSPFPQHKGKPLFVASVRTGKAYVSYHLLPLYMNNKLAFAISPTLKKRMQGKACFNFKAPPDAAVSQELSSLTATGIRMFEEKGWI